MNSIQNFHIGIAVFLAILAAVGVVGAVVLLRFYRDRQKTMARLRGLAADKGQVGESNAIVTMAEDTLPKLGRLLMPIDESRLTFRKLQLRQAGYYGPNALRQSMGAQVALMVLLPAILVLPPYAIGLLPLRWMILGGLIATCIGMLAPNAWLRSRVLKRQRSLRHALPDALDMLVLCLEAGVSLISALQRVTGELETIHPVLAFELNILQREVQLGQSAGEALRKLGDRCGLDDVRDLASVLLQSERYGASLVKTVRIYADGWRQDRQNRAEEMAQKAAVKILFPTLLCIFPAIFIVLLGPAAMQIARMFAK